jgi:putative mRNA 3-end processing factor
MSGFATSKGLQDIYLTQPTLHLLIAEFNADLSVRDNLIPIELGRARFLKSSALTLLPSDHMLGSAQVFVELKDGYRVGYSGDFQWPLGETIKVDELVIDSTYGSPESVRQFSQEEAETALLNIANEKLRHGPLHIKAHRGTLHRGLQVLSEIGNCPIIASKRLCCEIEVYRKFGYPIGTVLQPGHEDSADALKSGRFMRFYGTGDQFPVQPQSGTTITLSAFMTDPTSPLMEYTDRALNIALSNHADFNGTLEYIRATGAKRVVTDNARGGHAVGLANEIRHRLGIEAEPSDLESSHEWGV